MSASSRTASSRRSAPPADPPPAFVARVARAVERCLDREAALVGDEVRVLVAFSGGIDSTVLLHAAARCRRRDRVVAVHVHHGLQPAADAWPAHCVAVARGCGVDFESVRVDGAPTPGASVEAWARDARYLALARVADRLGARSVLVAHHADDQVETMLMRLARGAGVDGLAAMSETARRGELRIVRPLLALARADLERYARHFGLRWVEDPSNGDARRLRNAVRHGLLPALDRADPAFRATLLAMLPAIRAARERERALAAADLERALRDGGALDRAALAALDDERLSGALRAWLRERGARAPSRARLGQMRSQLVRGGNAHALLAHDGWVLLRHRDRIDSVEAGAFERIVRAGRAAAFELRWQGEPRIELPDALGWLRFEHVGGDAAAGVGAGWLRGRALVVDRGVSARRLRPDPDRPARTLKNLYQEHGVPAWLRAAFPNVLADGALLYAAPFGIDRSPRWPDREQRVTLAWEPPCASDPRTPYGASHQVQSPIS